MKIKLISDLHFEFFEDQRLFNNEEKADVLVVAGDLAVGHLPVWSALKRFADQYQDVVYVAGNHEYYMQSMPAFDDYITRFSLGTNIHFMNPGLIKIQDVTFFGGTLWTNFREDHFAKMSAKSTISDFRLIRELSTDRCITLYSEHLEYIKLQYEATNTKKVIVTHFLPTVECTAPRFKSSGIINYYFANDLGDWVENLKDTTWLFGHTHDAVDIKLGDTRLIANPYGYNLNETYKPLIIEL